MRYTLQGNMYFGKTATSRLGASLIAIIMAISFTATGGQRAYSAEASWLDGPIEYHAEPFNQVTYPYPPDYPSMGLKKQISIVDAEGKPQSYEAYESRAGSASLAYAYQINQWYVMFDSDSVYTPISEGSMQHMSFWVVDNGKKIVMSYKGNWQDGFRVAIIENLREYMKLSFNGEWRYYEPQVDTLSYWLQYTDEGGVKHSPPLVYGFTFSKNTRYGVFWMGWQQFVRVDFSDESAPVGFLNRIGTWYDGVYASRASAITNDGKYVFMDGGKLAVQISSDCGTFVLARDYAMHGTTFNFPTCRERIFDPTSMAGYDALHTSFALSDDERSFTYKLSPYPHMNTGTHPEQKVEVSLPPAHSITYLALGDSYTSGEGDIEKRPNGMNYYLPLTDDGSDTCHISSRSYPFLLRDAWSIETDDMKSIACSGARLTSDYYRPMKGYLGQGRRLQNNSDIAQAQHIALERYIPGRVPQFEFVKKYQPEIVTLTGGGNDVGFADIIKYCASALERCGFAHEGDMHDNLMASIDDQYVYTKQLLNKIKEVSPRTDVYMIGYPQFLPEGFFVCGLNAGLLDSFEIDMISRSVKRLNAVLARAAKDSGVKYIDVEDALDGGRICEGSEYMTGVVGGFFDNKNLDNSNMFHPNATGHRRLAKSIIESKAIVDAGYVKPIREVPLFSRTHSIVRQEMAGSVLEARSEVKLSTEPGTFQPRSKGRWTIHSESIDLGSVDVDDTGVLSWEGVLPARIVPGFHLLTATGVNQAGEPIQAQQFITILASSDDTTDMCTLMPGWYDETTDRQCESTTQSLVDQVWNTSDVSRALVTDDHLVLDFQTKLKLLADSRISYDQWGKLSNKSDLREIVPQNIVQLRLTDNSVLEPNQNIIHSDQRNTAGFDQLLISAGVLVFISSVVIALRYRYIREET